MQPKIISEHVRKMRLKTIVPIFLIGTLFIICVTGIVAVVYMYATKQKIKLSDAVFIICAGGVFGCFLSIMLVRFIRRMLSVRKVLLLEGDRIGVITWRGKSFTADLPDNIKHMLLIGTDLTVTLQIESKIFVIDNEQFSNKDGINNFLHRFLERYRASK